MAQDGLVAATQAARASAVATIRATTTRRTGALEDNWSESWRGPTLRGLTSFAEHGRFIEEGTKPHRIQARRVGFLAFQMGGVMMFRRAVNHPGTKARPFVALAQASGQMALRESLRSGVDRIARAF